MERLYEFELVLVDPDVALEVHGFDFVRKLLLELQPARLVELVGGPPRVIRVVAIGDRAEVAPGVLTEIERRVGTSLKVVSADL